MAQKSYDHLFLGIWDAVCGLQGLHQTVSPRDSKAVLAWVHSPSAYWGGLVAPLIRALIRDARPLIGQHEAENIQESVRSLGEVSHKGKKVTAQPIKEPFTCAACKKGQHYYCSSKRCVCGMEHL